MTSLWQGVLDTLDRMSFSGVWKSTARVAEYPFLPTSTETTYVDYDGKPSSTSSTMTKVENRSWQNDPRDLGPWEKRRHCVARPTVRETYREYVQCVQRSTNTTIYGFGEPNSADCHKLLITFGTAVLFSDEESLKRVLDMRKQRYAPDEAPWKPKPAYVEWLKAHDRWKPNSDGTTTATTGGAACSMEGTDAELSRRVAEDLGVAAASK